MTNGFHQIKLPQKVRPGQAVKADDYNKLIDAIGSLVASLKFLALQPSPDLGIRRGPNGTTAWLKSRRNGGSSSSVPDQFEIVGLRYDTTEEVWKCKVSPGWVLCRNPKEGEDVLKYWMPVDGSDVPLDAIAEDVPAGPPEFVVEAGDVIGIRVTTTEKDIIEEAPIVEIGAEDEESTHSQPPATGVPGEYFYRLAMFEELALPEGSPPEAIPELVVSDIFHEGPLEHSPHLPEHRNIGGKREVCAGRDAASDAYDFRTLEQLDGDGEPVIVPLDPGDPEGDPPVAPEAEGETIKFRRIRPRVSSPQININGDDPDAIEIRGNSFGASETNIRNCDISVSDGLVTSLTKKLAGVTGIVALIHTPAGSSSIQLSIHIQDGSIVLVDGGTSNTGDWDADVPGFADFITADTT
jgi:hypothetical protein